MTELRTKELLSERDENNSTSATLGGGGVFPGATTLLDNVATILIALFADVASATDGLSIEFSHDGADWHVADVYTIGAGSYKTYTFQPVDRYFRLRYTNGAAPQGNFHISTTLLTGNTKPSSHRLEDNVSGQDDATLQKSIVAGRIPSGVYSNIDATAGGALKTIISEENQDAFGRVRISDPVALLDSTFAYNLNPRIFEDISSGNGTASFLSNARAASLAITAGAPGVAGLQSYQYTHYNPGKSHLILVTFDADPNANTFGANQKFEVGYFDDDNGIFARFDSTGPQFVQRSSVSGAAVDTAVAQASWNVDTLDGAGGVGNPSGVSLDETKSQILVIDLQFLGVGRVRIGFVISGFIFFAHEFNFANLNNGMYMQSATLPVRWMLTDTGVAGFNNSEAYCCMVTTEGGNEQDRGIPFSIGNPPGTLITAASGADTHLVTIRPKLTFNALANRIWNLLESVEVLNTGSTEVLCKVWYGAPPTPVGAYADVDLSDSGMEYIISATHAAGTGICIARFTVPASAQVKGSGGFAVQSRLPIGLNRAAAAQVGQITLTAAGIGGTSAVMGIISWREIR